MSVEREPFVRVPDPLLERVAAGELRLEHLAIAVVLHRLAFRSRRDVASFTLADLRAATGYRLGDEQLRRDLRSLDYGTLTPARRGPHGRWSWFPPSFHRVSTEFPPGDFHQDAESISTDDELDDAENAAGDSDRGAVLFPPEPGSDFHSRARAPENKTKTKNKTTRAVTSKDHARELDDDEQPGQSEQLNGSSDVAALVAASLAATERPLAPGEPDLNAAVERRRRAAQRLEQIERST